MLDRMSKRDWRTVTLAAIVAVALLVAAVYGLGIAFWWGDR